MKNIKKEKKISFVYSLLLAAVLASGFAVRFVKLDSVPPGFYIDEASFGYNAYSILKTGSDEYGVRFPLYTKSFGTGKNPVYLYATVASVALFGLNETAERLPAAVFGALTVWLTFLLGAAMTKRREVGLLAALFLALNPWHIFFSRFGIEITSTVFFVTLGMYFLFRGLEQPRLLPWSSLAFGIGLYTYAPALIFTPFIIVAFIVCYRGRIVSLGKPAMAAVMVLAVLAVPHLIPGIKPAEQVKHFRRTAITNLSHEMHSRELLRKSPWPAPLFVESGRPVLTAATYVRNYLSYYSPSFLFFRGDLSTWRAHVKGYGQFYRFFIPVLLIGLPLMLFSRRPERRFLLLWFLIFPLGPAITNQTYPEATRSVLALPCFQLIFAITLTDMTELIRKSISYDKNKLSRAFFILTVVIFAVIYFCFSGLFVIRYFDEYPQYAAYEWNAGFREAINAAESNKSEYDYIIVTKNIPYSYIYILFYTKYDPEVLIENPLIQDGELRYGRLGKYEIADPRVSIPGSRVLYITGIWERPDLRPADMHTSGRVPSIVKIGGLTPRKIE